MERKVDKDNAALQDEEDAKRAVDEARAIISPAVAPATVVEAIEEEAAPVTDDKAAA